VEDFLKIFGLQSSNSVSIPLDPSIQLPTAADTGAEVDQRLYQRMVGKLMYAMIGTRPDLAFTVSTLAKFTSAPTTAHLAACKRAMRYLRRTSSYGIRYGGNNGVSCIGYTDSDYAGDRENRKSTSGYVFMACGGAISWTSRQQTSVALSTTEAEYVAATEACKELIWLNRLMKDLSILSTLPPPVLYIDNQAALSLARNPSHHSRTKHIDVRYHFIRTEVAAGTINLQQIGTKENTADICTKALPKPTFEYHRMGMGVVSIC
jgi:hypothetical protein